MTAKTPASPRLRVAHLNPRQPTAFALSPDAAARAAIAGELGISALPRLSFAGELRAEGGDGWRLTARLAARVVQPCVVTLAPVTSSLDEAVTRHFSQHLADPEGDEVEMPDDTLEPLGQFIDLEAAMIEALALALPEYPRAAGAALTPTAPAQPEASETRRPFAGLDKLLGGPRTGDGDAPEDAG